MSAAAAATIITLPPLYGWVLLDAVLIGIHILLTGFAVAPLRRRLFRKEFFETHFPQLLKGKFSIKGGYPDAGQGRYSDKLSDEDWIQFNSYQRAHANYIEGAVTVIVALLISGLTFPRSAALAGLMYIIGRQVYNFGYWFSGPGGRGSGAAILDIALVYLGITSIYSAYSIGGGCDGFKQLLGF